MHDPNENENAAVPTHAHEHGDPHSHEHDREGRSDHGEAKPLDRLYALMKYMTGHNADHTRELEAMAGRLKEAGNEEACELTMEAVRFFDRGNEVLARALEKLSG